MACAKPDDYSDLTELGIDVEAELDEDSKEFNKCIRHVQSIAATLDNEVLLKLYGLYKQSIEGPCKAPKPSWYDLKGKSKWESWKSLGDMDQLMAKRQYVQLVLTLAPHLPFKETKDKSNFWVSVSCMAPECKPMNQNVLDYIRNSEVEQVEKFLDENEDKKNELDASGMGLIHYSADIGNSEILQLLITKGININLQDGEGQTALHYASSCGHLDCIKLLLSNGAHCDIKDSDGLTALDIASDESVKKLFST
ncbi:hypothetical protein ABEB36_001043 [Hypothenemus hampei]|uniref:Acyl-CoA-binding domain-containing protein 6 n=1 Tax=Hypothenemus hampei TaxID=57062 RepID=A0ABD1FGK8_HYPHA